MSKSIFWDVCTKKEFEANGEKQELWFKIGVVKTTTKGAMFLQLFQQPYTDFFIFKPQEEEIPTIS